MSETPQRSLEVLVNDDRVGVLREADDLWAFEYAETWVRHPEGYDLSPALSRSEPHHVDGASSRPVQWYFDNLLPEEQLRTVLAREARVDSEDAFGLLAHFGAESAGSLVLRPPGAHPPVERGLRPLPDEALSQRIRDLPRVSLVEAAPKHMSLAGAQHKLAVVADAGGQLFEPLPGEAATHILKPDHLSPDYPWTVANEYFVMRLASRLGLIVPAVQRRYVPQPVYVIERFDRRRVRDVVQRLHVIDACQLLNKARAFKYSAARIDTLQEAIALCRSRAAARLSLFRWLAFNALAGNADNHLKNVSFLVSAQGIDIAPFYDLVSTGAYATPAFSQQPQWPAVPLALPLPGATTFAQVTRTALVDAAQALGIARPTASRELDRLVHDIAPAAEALLRDIEGDNERLPRDVRAVTAGEGRLLRAIVHVVIRDMTDRLANS